MLLEIPTVEEVIGELSIEEINTYNEIVEGFISESSKATNMMGSEITVQISKRLISDRLNYRLKTNFNKSKWDFSGSYFSDSIKFFISIMDKRGV